MKVPSEVTLSQLIRMHVAVPPLPATAVFTWGKVTGKGAPGRLQEGNVVEVKPGNQEPSRCFVYKGFGQFADPLEIDISTAEEPEVLAEANRLNAQVGMNAQYYQGLEKLPRLMPVKERLIFPKDIERSQMDSPTQTGLVAERIRTVGPMRRIRRMLTGSKGKELSGVQDATIPEDVLPSQF
jgi:hypothetical protein